jgi:hypothetical protein
MPNKFIACAALGFLLVFGGKSGSSQEIPGLILLAKCDFENGKADGWRPDDFSLWRVAAREGSMAYELTVPGAQGKVRAPTSWSLLAGHDLTSFVFSGRLQCDANPANDKRDMCVYFHFQDPTHFYYVHFSASSDEFHNIIGLVNGADRVKINRETPGTSVFRLTDRSWHEFKVTFDEKTGEINAFLDDMTKPILTARDETLHHGLVGVGSFDDTGRFDDLKLWGRRR